MTQKTTVVKYPSQLRTDIKGKGCYRYGRGQLNVETYKQHEAEIKSMGLSRTAFADILATFNEEVINRFCETNFLYMKGLGYVQVQKRRLDPAKHTQFMMIYGKRLINPNWIFKIRLFIFGVKGRIRYYRIRFDCKNAKPSVLKMIREQKLNFPSYD